MVKDGENCRMKFVNILQKMGALMHCSVALMTVESKAINL